MIPARFRTPTSANGYDPLQDPARSRAGVPTIPSRSHVIPRRSTHNPLTIPHNGILQGHDPRTIPHTHLCKWIRSPHDPARSREGVLTILARSHAIPRRSTHDPLTIPRNGILQGYDPRAIPHPNLCKRVRPPHDSEKGCLGSPHDPMRSRGEALTTPSRSRTTASYNGMIPARFHTPTFANGYDPHTIPHDLEKGCARSPHDPAQRHPTRL